MLVALEPLTTADPHAALLGVDVSTLARELGVMGKPEGEKAIISAVNDLEVVGCVDADGLFVKMTTQGHKFARAGGLRPVWKSLFSAGTIPLDR